jgi:hypothetical protein
MDRKSFECPARGYRFPLSSWQSRWRKRLDFGALQISSLYSLTLSPGPIVHHSHSAQPIRYAVTPSVTVTTAISTRRSTGFRTGYRSSPATGLDASASHTAGSVPLTLPITAWPPSFICTCSMRTTCGPPVRRWRRTSSCIAYAFSKRAAVDPNAAVRRCVAKPLSILTTPQRWPSRVRFSAVSLRYLERGRLPARHLLLVAETSPVESRLKYRPLTRAPQGHCIT